MTTTPRTVRIRPDDRPRRRGGPALALALGATAIVLAVGGGAVAIGVSVAGSLRDETSTDVVPGVREVVVDVDEGSVALRAGTSPDLVLRTTRIWADGYEPVVERVLVDGVLTLTSDCPALNFGCEVGQSLVVPPGTAVTVRTVEGGIEAVDLDTDRFSATSVAGAVTASFSRPPGQVRAESVGGAVHLTLPHAEYRVESTSVTGEQRIGVAHVPAAASEVRARTVSGPIAIVPG